MFNYTETKDMTTNKIKDAARLEVVEKVLELLAPFDARRSTFSFMKSKQ